MKEVELKFQVPVQRRDAVDRAVAGPDRPRRMRLQAAYFDTPERALALAGLALRVRREGRRWVQTLKGAGSDGMTRAEHNVPITASGPVAAGAVPQADPNLHVGTAIGDRLSALLKSLPANSLACAYRTDIHRRSRVLQVPGGSVELAFDHGSIVTGGSGADASARVPVCELEIELQGGSPLAVIATARGWVARHGLWLDTRTKAERGDLLARGLAMAPALRAQAVRLHTDMSPAHGLQQVLQSCLMQVSINASQIASGTWDDEHLHQLRVGLRRLRTALRLFKADALQATLGEPAAALFRALGAARDAAAVAQPLAAALGRALAAAGMTLQLPALAAAQGAATPDPTSAIRAPQTQVMLLELLTQVQAEVSPQPDAASLRDLLAKRLNRWHRQVLADAARFVDLDDAERHVLRKRAKRLRYSVEFAEALFAKRRVRAYLAPLRAVQERLGELNDVVVGLAAYRTSSDADSRALFAVGWLSARRDELIAQCAPELAAFAEVKRFWKK